jgi:hypothetical protein
LPNSYKVKIVRNARSINSSLLHSKGEIYLWWRRERLEGAGKEAMEWRRKQSGDANRVETQTEWIRKQRGDANRGETQTEGLKQRCKDTRQEWQAQEGRKKFA